MKISRRERIFTGTWHLALTVGHVLAIWILPQRWAKWLSLAAAVWHADATINDCRGTETYLKRGLRVATGNHG